MRVRHPAGAARRPLTAVLAGALAGTLALTGCTSDSPAAPSPSGSPSSASSADTPAVAVDDPALDAAESTPVEDRVYPRVGDPGVDALHYDLDLSWDPDSRTLTGVETLVFRATADAEQFQLDFGAPLEVSAVRLDGADATYDHAGKDLVVHEAVTGDRRYTLVVEYAGTPKPVAAPTTRTDFSTLGWTIARGGGTWTMQEPFGAYSWYAVNDQPSDKALYDFTITAPDPMVGVANGTLESRVKGDDGTTVTQWHLDEPASSYLVTVAIGDYEETRDRSDSGVPVTYWTPRGQPRFVRRVQAAADELDWIESKLGAYPFSSLGILLVDSESGMETQTMITLGTDTYATSRPVIVHEMVHQWYGDEVTPVDWRDVWMNEGMAMYLQLAWQADNAGAPIARFLRQYAAVEPALRREAGPPADYDPASFGRGNVYYSPALMWHQLRQQLGEKRFWSGVRAWPRAHVNGNASYDDITTWWSERTGRDLSAFFDAWLLGKRSPRS
jgi:aminopeptidase N